MPTNNIGSGQYPGQHDTYLLYVPREDLQRLQRACVLAEPAEHFDGGQSYGFTVDQA